jgi:hypothetical protein
LVFEWIDGKVEVLFDTSEQGAFAGYLDIFGPYI